MDIHREFVQIVVLEDGLVRQGGGAPASHGRITKPGRAHARVMLVEAAWVAVKTPGSLRAFYERIRLRRGMQIAIVATARKLAVLCWHLVIRIRRKDYAFARPSPTDKKLRALELRAGLPPRRGQKSKAAAYSLKEVRRREPDLAEQGEPAYRQLVADWQAKTPKSKLGVAATNGTRLSRPLRGKLRGRHQSQNLRFAPGSTTPTRKPNAS